MKLHWRRPNDVDTTACGKDSVMSRPVHYAIEPVKIKPRSKRGQRNRTWKGER